jgi:hypothetical protein
VFLKADEGDPPVSLSPGKDLPSDHMGSCLDCGKGLGAVTRRKVTVSAGNAAPILVIQLVFWSLY